LEIGAKNLETYELSISKLSICNHQAKNFDTVITTGGFQESKYAAPNFPVFRKFRNASYIDRYDILCKKLVQE
jgi:Restriction endonuclease XhoI